MIAERSACQKKETNENKNIHTPTHPNEAHQNRANIYRYE